VLQVGKSSDSAEDDRESIQVCLQSKDTSGNSGEIVGILKEMFETMTKRVEEITRAEEEAVANFNQLVAAKNRELSAAQDSIEEKTQRQGEVAVQIATLKNDLDETSATLEKDEDYSASLEKNCKAKAQEYEGVKKTRAEELLALADTIKMLNSDDALELFKKALPSPESLLQMDATEKSARAEALAVVRNAARKFHHTKLDLLAMAISGKKEGFEYIVKLTKKMVASLKEEQAEDDNKLAYCEKEIVAKENAKKELSHELEGLDAHITADNNSVDTLKGDLKDLNANIKALDKSVAEATEQRKQEHSDYVSDVADDNASVQLIEMCINRMNKVYQPKQYKEDADSFVQLSASDAPEAFGSSSPNKGGKGVVLMLQKIRDDLKSSMNQEAMEEKDSQEDYERLMTDSTATRATYVAARTEKEAALADANADLTDTKSRRAETSGDMDEVKESIFALHASCDFLQNNYDARKSARNEEIESLEKSESVLGSDVSFMQTKSSFLRRN
jgi:chromosome segregation ATPase